MTKAANPCQQLTHEIDTYNQLEPSFELWWNDGPHRTALDVAVKTARESDLSASNTTLATMVCNVLDALRDDALSLAIHTHTSADELDSINSVTDEFWREFLLAEYAAQQAQMDEIATALSSFNINVDGLKAHFAPV